MNIGQFTHHTLYGMRGEKVEKSQVVCMNVFKNKDEKSIQAEFTKMWIALINYIESSKVVP